MLSERFWTSQFGGDPRLVGSTVTLDGEPFTVIGIVPSQFQILRNNNLWTIFAPERKPEQRRMHYLQVLGRLKRGVKLDRAKAGMGGVAENIARQTGLEKRIEVIAIGLGIGLVVTVVLTQSLKSMLFGVKPIDPLTFAVAASTLIIVALTACAIPALRAAKVHPSSALRQE